MRRSQLGETSQRPHPTRPADTPAPVHSGVFALQRLAGNRAVGRMLGEVLPASAGRLLRDPDPAPLAAGVLTQNPEVSLWSVRVERGGQGGDAERIDPGSGAMRVFIGDTAVVRAQFQTLQAYDHDFIGHSVVSAGGVDVTSRWADAKTHEWRFQFTSVGTGRFAIEVTQDTPIDDYEERFTVVSDLADFTLACVEAQSVVRGRFDRASRQINQAASAFRKAFAAQQADLDEVAARQKMLDDLIFGALFAAAGGFAGGFAGSWMKKVKDKAFEKQDWWVDAAKDTVKFAVRSGDKLRGGNSPSVQGDSSAPGDTAPSAPRGQFKAAGKDPLDFLADLGARVAAEGQEAQDALTALISEARRARSAQSKADFDEDPIAVATKDLTLEQITAELSVDPNVYLKGLWKTWLEAYANRAYETGVLSPLPAVRRKVEKAASAMGEKADEWFDQWADPAGAWNAEKQKELDKRLEKEGPLYGP